MSAKRIEPMDDHLLITKEELEEFKQLALKEYGIRLTDEQAYEQGSALLRLVDCMIKKTVEKKRMLLGRSTGNKNSLQI